MSTLVENLANYKDAHVEAIEGGYLVATKDGKIQHAADWGMVIHLLQVYFGIAS